MLAAIMWTVSPYSEQVREGFDPILIMTHMLLGVRRNMVYPALDVHCLHSCYSVVLKVLSAVLALLPILIAGGTLYLSSTLIFPS